jgi:hypothetical protein
MTAVLLLMMVVMILVITMAGVVLMQLLGAFRPFEFMALAGNGGQRDGDKQQGEKFHRGAS